MKAKKENRSTVKKAFRAYIYHHEENIVIKMDVKGASHEVSEGNEEDVTGETEGRVILATKWQRTWLNWLDYTHTHTHIQHPLLLKDAFMVKEVQQ